MAAQQVASTGSLVGAALLLELQGRVLIAIGLLATTGVVYAACMFI